MPRSTYHDQIKILICKGYLVPSHGNTFDFYETPREGTKIQTTTVGQNYQPCMADRETQTNAVTKIPSEDTEINNNIDSINKDGINIDATFGQTNGEFVF